MGAVAKLPSKIPLSRRVYEREVSTFLLRFEDLVENPVLAVRSVLACFGVQNLVNEDTDLQIFLEKVRSSGASSSTASRGSGFELVTKLDPKWYRELHAYLDVLEKFRYSYFHQSSGGKRQLGLKVSLKSKGGERGEMG